MNYTDYYVLTTFVVMLYFLKKYYDKYSSTSKLLKNLINEIENSSNQLLEVTNSKNLLELKIKSLKDLLEQKEQVLIKTKNEIINQKENFELDRVLLKKDFELKLKESNDSARKDAIKKSRAVIRGQATEHLAPYILKETNPKDYRFLGNPIDYVCFEGLSNLLDGTVDEIKCIHFIDIKTGKSNLNKSQRRIRDAIKDSRVKFSLINLDKEIQDQYDKTQEQPQTSNKKES